MQSAASHRHGRLSIVCLTYYSGILKRKQKQERKKGRKKAKGKRKAVSDEDEDEDEEQLLDPEIDDELQSAFDEGEQPSDDLTETVSEWEARMGRDISAKDLEHVVWAFIKWDDLAYDEGGYFKYTHT
jgi:chromodomain-helicase-DNA-binding protein 4